MTVRVIGGTTYNLSYNAENRLVSISGGTSASFVYDGDGNRAKGTVGGVTTTYIGNWQTAAYEHRNPKFLCGGLRFEWSGSTATMVKYYYVGSQRVAVMAGSTVYYLLTDHLGSTSLTVTSAGVTYGEKRYKPWGEERYTSGTTPTSFRFTGQRIEASLGGASGLYYYGARWLDPALGRFLSADTLVPDPYHPLAYDRYQYVYSNPIRYNDPSGHCFWDLCIVEGVGIVELALLVTGGAAALYVSTPGGREATTVALTEGLDWITDQLNSGLDRLRALTKSTTPKPLTSDEQGHVDKLNKGIDDFLSEHPDLAKEAEQVSKGEALPKGKDHVTEAKNLARGLENSIGHLQNVRDKRTADAQQAIDEAIENAQKQLDKLHEILGDW